MNKLNYGIITLLGIISFIPLLWVIITSFSPGNQVINGGFPFWVVESNV